MHHFVARTEQPGLAAKALHTAQPFRSTIRSGRCVCAYGWSGARCRLLFGRGKVVTYFPVSFHYPRVVHGDDDHGQRGGRSLHRGVVMSCCYTSQREVCCAGKQGELLNLGFHCPARCAFFTWQTTGRRRWLRCLLMRFGGECKHILVILFCVLWCCKAVGN